MVTFLAGGTGTPKLLDGVDAAFSLEDVTVVANTGDDVEMGGLFVSPDVDTVLFHGGGVLDRETWWGIEDDTTETHDELRELCAAAGFSEKPRYLDERKQTAGRRLSRWRRFSGASEFMTLGDRDRAIHVLRTSLLDEGKSLTTVTQILADALGVPYEVLPMSDDPVASIVHTPDGAMHFQEFWLVHRGDVTVEAVEFRGAEQASPAPGVLDSLDDVVVIGPSNPVTSIGPMLAVPGIADAVRETTVVAVSPFVEDEPFSGPVSKLMPAIDAEASTAGLASAYPFADAFVLDERDRTALERPTVRTDTTIDGPADAERVVRAVEEAIRLVA